MALSPEDVQAHEDYVAAFQELRNAEGALERAKVKLQNAKWEEARTLRRLQALKEQKGWR